jgi:hypothetical protein
MPEAQEQALVVAPKAVQKRKPRSAKGIAQLQAKTHAEYFPEIFREFYVQLKDRVAKGDIDALKMVADIAKLTGKNSPLVSVTTNVQQNNTSVNTGRDRRFEGIVRKLELKEQEQSRLRSDVQDAEFEDVEPDAS